MSIFRYAQHTMEGDFGDVVTTLEIRFAQNL